MDITKHLAVIRRWHKLLLLSGLLGLLLGFLLTFKVSFDGGPKAEYRRAEKWQSVSTLFVTQRGFPWGRTTLPGGTDSTGGPTGADQTAAPKPGDTTSFADPARLGFLANIYSFVTASDGLAQIAAPLPPGGEVSAQVLTSGNSPLPLFQLTTKAQSAAAATALNVARTRALVNYLATQQQENSVPVGQRVSVQVLNKPQATIVAGHGAIFGGFMVILALGAGLAAAYVLESLRLSRERGTTLAGEIVHHPNASTWTEPRERSVR